MSVPAPQIPTSQPPASEAKPNPHVLGIIALVFAIIGFIFACIPGALIVGWILLPIAFILSIVALFMKGRKWPAITGLIVAVVGTIVGFVVFFAVVVAAANAALNDAVGSNVPAPAPTGTIAVEAAEQDPAAAEQDFVVTIDGAKQTKDFEGKPALIVSYTFTNNSDDAANFMFAAHAQAFQDGVELESAILTDDSVEIEAAMKDIKPGKSLKVQEAYLLDGKSEVSIEVTPLISFDDTMLATKTVTVK